MLVRRPASDPDDSERGRRSRPVRLPLPPPGFTRDDDRRAEPTVVALLQGLAQRTGCPASARSRIRARVLSGLVERRNDLPCG